MQILVSLSLVKLFDAHTGKLIF